jgi:hypothetical protein
LRGLLNSIKDDRRRKRAFLLLKLDIKDRGISKASIYKILGVSDDFDFDAIEIFLRRLSLKQASALTRRMDADDRAMLEEVSVPSEEDSMAQRSLT